MKQKIIFMVINMNIGGTEKALLNMIAEMPKERYDITILMLEKNGGFLDSIPEWVHVEVLNGYKEIKRMLNDPPKKVFWHLIKNGKLVKGLNVLILNLVTKLMKNRRLYFQYLTRFVPKLNQEYDIAVAYAGPMDFISYFVVNKINAKKRIQWIHFDITKVVFNRCFAAKNYKNFDKIFVVSEEGRNKFIQTIPSLKDKTETYINVVSPQLVEEMANEGIGFTDKFGGIRILTVGRLSKEKGQDLTVPVLSQLKKDGYNVGWYCVGEGKAREEYEKIIKSYGLEDDYILLGSNPNPYSFMKQCDVYVQPSRHEGYCITLAEAKCFQIPIITTDFVGAHEQIQDGVNGYIVECNKEDIYEKVKFILDSLIGESLGNRGLHYENKSFG